MYSIDIDESGRKQYFIDNLERALAEGWINAYSQPLVRTANGKVCNEEALARWIEPGYEPIHAKEFIPALEEAGLAYKIDLFIVEQVLHKMKQQQENGLFVVPESVNISGTDFYSCNIVDEVVKRIDASGLDRDRIAVEISEQTVARDTVFFEKQVENFNRQGIDVWLDDYGSGFLSPLIVLKIPFRLVKIGKEYIEQIGQSEKGMIILAELIKMAVAIGIDTVAAGIENNEEADFLKEIGCAMLQGNLYTPPISTDEILSRYRTGIQIGFENPDEADYYEKLSRLNLYDLSFSKNDDKSLNRYFDTMPAVVYAIGGEKAEFVRCNKSYRDFINHYFPNFILKGEMDLKYIDHEWGRYTYTAVSLCAREGKRMIIEERTRSGLNMQFLMYRIAVNPVSNVSAVVIVVLSINDNKHDDGITYNYVARALSKDYMDLFFVDLDTEEFIRYSPDQINSDVSVERHGNYFFDQAHMDAFSSLYPGDYEMFKSTFVKSKVIEDIEKEGVFSLTYRRMIGKKPEYVNLKAVKVRNDVNQIIIGINNVDTQMRQRESFERVKEERLFYSRIGALSGNIIYVFTVEPDTGKFTKYSSGKLRSDMGIDERGEDFYSIVRERARTGLYSDDVDEFLKSFTKENVLDEIKNKGAYIHEHRLYMSGSLIYVILKAVMTYEDGKPVLIVGVINTDDQVKKEQEYVKNLSEAQNKANLDELTGVRNKHAYAEMQQQLDKMIKQGEILRFAVIVFDINDLKKVNDTLGHQAGDRFIKRGCDIICRIFAHSPVYRVGGDEFVVIAKGNDYRDVEFLMDQVANSNYRNIESGDVLVAAGMAKYDNDECLDKVFERADVAMYNDKKKLKHDKGIKDNENSFYGNS